MNEKLIFSSYPLTISKQGLDMDSEPIRKTYAVVPGLNMGLFAPQDLESILRIINKYDVPATKITSAQRLALLGMAEEKIAALQIELKGYIRKTAVNGVHYVQACPGLKWCKYGIGDSLTLGKKLEDLSLEEPLKAKVKVGVSGCRMCCTEPYLRDVGIFATKKGWTLIFGGNGGGRPRIGDIIGKNLSDEDVLVLVKKCLRVYQENNKPSSRTARFMERFGVDAFTTKLLVP
jgi:NAD(P)H-nitrite reductase large subunit